ncbi:MAG: hypothetical protein DMF62_13400 [Acidobacteria bacterium]|nr:MAG: hypothetical protein DMF62_13400 [Acidobacteriota bacterium]
MSNRLRYFYEFGEFRFDPESKVLHRDGESVSLPPKATEVLALLIEERGNLVERETILNTVWEHTFVEDGNLNNAVSTLRKTLGGNRIIQTVPRRGYRFAADVSRVAEEEIEEIVIERRTVSQTTILTESEGAAGLNPEASRKYIGWFLASGLALIVVAVGVFMLKGPTSGRPFASVQNKTIAILPLKIIGNGEVKSDDPAPFGIAENLAARLGGLRGLTVLSTRASARLAESETDPLAIGQKLGAQAVIDGSYQVTDDKVKVLIRMLDVADGSQLWSGAFDEKQEDILRLEDTLASQAANSLSLRLTADEIRRLEKPATDDAEAYKLYLRGRYEWGKRTQSGLQQSISVFRQAIDRDPSFALAYAGLADSYALLADYNIEPPAEAFPKAKAAALKSLEIDPKAVRPRTTLAYVQATFEWDYAEAERQYKTVIEAEPSYATAHQWYGELLYALRRYDEATVQLDRALQLDPLVPITLSEHAALLYYQGDLDGALAQFSSLKSEHPDFSTAYIFTAWIHGLKGNEQLAFENEIEFLKLQGMDNTALDELRAAFNSGGYLAFLRKTAERNVDQVKRNRFPGYKIPHTFARLRDREQTLYWIEKCIENHTPNIIKIASDRNFDFVRDDPRFRSALVRLNLA